MKSNLMTYLIVPMMIFLWSSVSFFYLSSSMVLLNILMAPLMVAMMAFLRVHKWKPYLVSNLMANLMVPMMAFLWVHKWKFQLASSIVLIKANIMNPLMVLGTRHT